MSAAPGPAAGGAGGGAAAPASGIAAAEAEVGTSLSRMFPADHSEPLGRNYLIGLYDMVTSLTPADVIGVYFGAFGPPTLGHLIGMLLTALEHIKNYPGKHIYMLWMPTAQSGSKAHLEPTQNLRLQALRIYNQILTAYLDHLGHTNVTFLASPLEYEIYRVSGQTGKSIYTLLALRKLFPSALLTATMGIDNLLDLLFWLTSYQYFLDPINLQGIYITNRDFAATKEEGGIKMIQVESTDTEFHPVDQLVSANGKPFYLKNVKPAWAKVSAAEWATKVSPSTLQSKIFILGKPPGTSSSLLRCIMRQAASASSAAVAAVPPGATEEATAAAKAAASAAATAPYSPMFKTLVGLNAHDARPWHEMRRITDNFASDAIKCSKLDIMAEGAKLASLPVGDIQMILPTVLTSSMAGGYRRKTSRKNKNRKNKNRKSRKSRKNNRKTRN